MSDIYCTKLHQNQIQNSLFTHMSTLEYLSNNKNNMKKYSTSVTLNINTYKHFRLDMFINFYFSTTFSHTIGLWGSLLLSCNGVRYIP